MPEKQQFKCTSCGSFYTNQESNFYLSASDLFTANNGRMCICKNCVLQMYEKYYEKYKEEKIAIYKLCEKLDVCFNVPLFVGAIKEANEKGKNVAQVYFTKLNSFGSKNGTGKVFDDSDKIEEKEIKNAELGVNEEENDDYDVTHEIIRRWGRGLEKADYRDLEEDYADWLTHYECDSKAMETLIKEICFQSLDIKKRRQNGEKVDQQLKTLQDLLGSSNLKPVQETGANATDQATFGTLIKKWENEKPIPEPLEEFKDVDGIQKYFSVWFLGHLCKILNIDNAYSQMYEEEVSKYTVESPSNNEDGGE